MDWLAGSGFLNGDVAWHFLPQSRLLASENLCATFLGSLAGKAFGNGDFA
jgi:hypothetical protein